MDYEMLPGKILSCEVPPRQILGREALPNCELLPIREAQLAWILDREVPPGQILDREVLPEQILGCAALLNCEVLTGQILDR